MLKRILLSLLVLVSLFIIGCDNGNKEPDTPVEPVVEEPTTTYLFIYNGDTFVEEREVAIGSTIDFKLEDPNYMFIGWYDETGETCLDGATVNDEMWLYAKTIKIGTSYIITYHTEDDVELVGDYASKHVVGTETTLIAPERPLKYKFAGWYDNAERTGEPITTIPADYYGRIDLWDSWTDENTYHTITYIADGAESYSEELSTSVMEGVEYLLPYPIKTGYYFRGWYLEDSYQTRVYKVTTDNTADLTVYAKFAVKTASDTYLTIVGDSISTYDGTIPVDAGAYYPSLCDLALNETYFMQVVKGLGVNLLKNNSYSGSRLSGDLVGPNGEKLPAACGDYRVSNLGDEEHDPDIIIVHLGTNEYSQGVLVERFKWGIKKFMEKVRALYDDVDVYFCLHPYNGYGPGYVAKREAYNQAILDLATEYNYKTIDLTKAWGEKDYPNYIFSNAHPNKAGFKRMAEVILEELKKDYSFK